jgi:predicted glycogen debranching enzyme
MKVAQADCRTLETALSLEWLDTNGRGGFSSGTVAGANTRRYHALLLVARTPPAERFVLVNQLEEWLDLDGFNVSLSTNCYPGTVHPSGYQSCTGFSSEPWPTWTFDCNGTTVQREILIVRGRDLVIVRWTLTGKQTRSTTLRVTPKVSGRGYHAIHRENSHLSLDATIGTGMVGWRMYPDVPPVRVFHNGAYQHDPQWYRQIFLPVEQERGLEHLEDWWSPGTVTLDLNSRSCQTLAFTSEELQELDVTPLIAAEQARRDLIAQSAPTGDPLAFALWRAGDAYLSQRGPRQTVIAGYPWFTDWGRDTFISLPGLCITAGRAASAWEIIETFSMHVSHGMVPNRFGDNDEPPEYNAMDASLWFVHAVDRYLTATGDDSRVHRTAWPVVRQILEAYRSGTRYGIHMGDDGLISGGAPGAQLTWMDVKIDGRVVTPRHGKPVEIQALWIKALDIGEAFGRRFDEAALADRCRGDRLRAVASFQERFWYEEGGYLYDVIDGPQGNDPSLRPNQLYALSLVDDLVPRPRAQQILRLVESELLTPVGLRTLSPRDPRYCPRYAGSVRERDAADHQGTVWPFLLGPFVTAWCKAFGNRASTRKKARGFLAGLEAHLREGCLDHVSEIFDGAPPYRPRGCCAQAWSAAEPLRALIEDLGAGIDAPAQKRAAAGRRSAARTPAQSKIKPSSKQRSKKSGKASPPP